MWLIEIVNLFLGHGLSEYSVYPRRIEKIYGIISMHFLHWGIGHLLSNTIPLLVLGFFVTGVGKFKQVTISIALLSGLLVWLFAREAFHAGASALVLGYWSYLISNAFVEKNFKNSVIALLTIVLYGGMLFSLLDFRQWVSFEGHIFGFLSGIASAWFWRNNK
jgi:membrane associated rhomboid family serine protease